MTYTCIHCNKGFVRYDNRTSGKFCSLSCFNEYRRSHPKPPNCECEVCGKKFYLKPSSLKQGMGKYCSRDCKHFKQRQNAAIVENETYNDRHLIRQSSLYKKWRRDALKLHENKCDKCGIKQHTYCKCCGNKIFLEVHHNELFSSNVERRFDPTNSTVFCRKCHESEHEKDN